jgi:hypothetical protein
MAYHLCDGFDNYGSSTERWSSVNGTMSYSSSYARFAAPAGLLGQGLKMGTSGAQWKQWNMVSNQATMIFGFAVYFPNLAATDGELMSFLDTTTTQCSIHVTATGAIQLQGGSGGAVLATSSPGVITVGWHWLDIEFTVNPSTGFVAIYVDQPAGGAPVVNLGGLNTRTSSNSYMNGFRIGDMSAVWNGLQLDDFHAHDNTGSAPNSILGESRVYTKKANGAGYTTNWTPNGAAANWQCSDDSPPDGDTTYNSSNTAGAIDGYAVPSAGLTVAPHYLVRLSYVRRDDAGPHTFQNGIRSAGTNALGTAFTVPSGYSWTDCSTCYVNDPATSSPWASGTAADAASMVIDETS